MYFRVKPCWIKDSKPAESLILFHINHYVIIDSEVVSMNHLIRALMVEAGNERATGQTNKTASEKKVQTLLAKLLLTKV